MIDTYSKRSVPLARPSTWEGHCATFKVATSYQPFSLKGKKYEEMRHENHPAACSKRK